MRYPRRFLNVVILLALLIILAAKLPGSLGARDIAITDQNMAPAYAAGDMVFLREEAFEQVKVGDVVCFSRSNGGESRLGRVISVDTEAKRLQVRSDSDSGGDGKGIMASQLNGVVSFKVPFLGYAGIWLASLENDALAVMLLAFLSMVSVILYAIETGREDRACGPSEVDVEEDFGGYEPKHSAPGSSADSGRRSMGG